MALNHDVVINYIKMFVFKLQMLDNWLNLFILSNYGCFCVQGEERPGLFNVVLMVNYGIWRYAASLI